MIDSNIIDALAILIDAYGEHGRIEIAAEYLNNIDGYGISQEYKPSTDTYVFEVKKYVA